METLPARSSVLIVEDDDSTARFLEAFLTRNGFHASTCENGREGFLKLITGNYHVVMLDLLMPGIDGFDVLRTVRETYFPFMKRIIVLTGASEMLYRGPIYENEIFARLGKPADPAQMIDMATRCAIDAGGVFPGRHRVPKLRPSAAAPSRFEH
ncbi:MAG: response regulator [Acidobacteria bacterium]|nr:response regulator [Acidobacteriota bacterium]